MNEPRRFLRAHAERRRPALALILGTILLCPLGAAAQTLPAGWTASDIGTPAVPGTASYSGGTYTISGAGADIWGTADQFTFTYRQLTGDGSVIARVASIQNIDQWSKAGVMIRESLSAGSKNAFVLVSAAKGLAFQRRTATNGTSVSTLTGGAAPMWVRLDRHGSTLTASRSSNGTTWTTIGSDTVSMTGNVYVGLAVTSHNETAASRATLTNVTVSGVVGALPSGWSAGDLGSPSIHGSSAYSSGTFGLTAGGTDIWGTSDQFQFASRQASGDIDAVARVTAVGTTNAWSKAGLMIRDSLTSNSAHATMFVSAAKGTAFQRRPAAGGVSVNTAGDTSKAPMWVKLSLRGSVVTAYQSKNGTTWTKVGTQSLSLPTPYYVGLALTSHDGSKAVTANFDNVSIQASSTNPPPPVNQPPSVSLTAPASGASFSAPATVTVSASASDTDGSIAKVEFYQGTTLIGSDTTSPFSITWSNVAAGSYSLTAVATDDDGAPTRSAARTITVNGGVPGGWTNADIGGSTPAGSTSVSGGTYTVKGGGIDIWGTSDQFQFAYLKVTGDQDVIARVATLGNTDPWAKAGVMIRASLAANAAHVSMLATSGNGPAYQRRPSTGADSVHVSGGTRAVPYWVKLSARSGVITASWSVDGTAWTTLGSQSITLPSPYYVGLAVSSHNTTAAVTATFDHVSVTVTASASDSDGRVAQVDFFANSTLIGSASGSPFTLTWNNASAGTYSLTAIATDDGGASTTSAARTITISGSSSQASKAMFTASPDHSTLVISYRLDIFRAGANPSTATPVATQDLGKPAVVNGDCTADITTTIQSLASGSYFATVSAVGSGGSSRSAASATFTR
jgi:regulation of enolase protein 1 (concanavalin A-like superfamily)